MDCKRIIWGSHRMADGCGVFVVCVCGVVAVVVVAPVQLLRLVCGLQLHARSSFEQTGGGDALHHRHTFCSLVVCW